MFLDLACVPEIVLKDIDRVVEGLQALSPKLVGDLGEYLPLPQVRWLSLYLVPEPESRVIQDI